MTPKRSKAMRGAVVAAALAGGSLATATPVAAEGTAPGARVQQEQRIDVARWDQAHLYEGFSASDLLDTEVRGPAGEQIGEVEDLIVDADGQVQAVVVEVGGFLDVGDTHVAVPWQDVVASPGLDYVSVPLDQERYEGFHFFDESRPVAGAGLWRVTELIYDYVDLPDASRYGRVTDLVFDREGEVQAVLIERSQRYGRPLGPYVAPYYAQEPGRRTYRVPNRRAQIERLGPFDFDRLATRRPDAEGG